MLVVSADALSRQSRAGISNDLIQLLTCEAWRQAGCTVLDICYVRAAPQDHESPEPMRQWIVTQLLTLAYSFAEKSLERTCNCALSSFGDWF